MSYQASGTVRCWKKYDCLGCGAVYRHSFSRTVSGTGGTAEQAEANAQQSGISALQNQVDSCPCPECGRVQPRMVGHSKLGGHRLLTVLIEIALAVLVILGSTDVIQREVCALTVAGVAAIGILAQMWCAGHNPNANPEANKQHAARKVASGEVEMLRPGDPGSGEPSPPLVTRSHFVYLLLGLFGAAVALIPVGVRVANGWELSNSDPPVLGPGDKFRIEFPDKIDCVKSTWNGSAQVTFEGDVRGATVRTNTESWGNSMAVKSSESHTSPTLWAEVTLPNDETLTNKEIRGRVDMTVTFPQASGVRGMSNQQKSVSKQFTVKLSTPNAWKTYQRAWWGGLVGCFVVTALAGWGFARQASFMKWDAPPDLIESLDTPPSDQPPERPATPPEERPKSRPW